MLEIILVIVMAGKIGKIVEEKGRSKFPFQAMFVAMWIGGEIFGAVVGGVMAATMSGGQGDSHFWLVYLFALGGAALGAIISFVIANGLSPAVSEEDARRRDWDADLSKFGNKGRSGGEDDRRRPDNPRGESEGIRD